MASAMWTPSPSIEDDYINLETDREQSSMYTITVKTRNSTQSVPLQYARRILLLDETIRTSAYKKEPVIDLPFVQEYEFSEVCWH